MINMKRKGLIVLVLMAVLLPAVLTIPASAAEPTTVLGTVKNTTGSPISGVTVTLLIGSTTKDTDYTDTYGRYDVTCSVSYRTLVTLKFTKSGYNTYSTTTYVYPGCLSIKNVVMTATVTQGVKGTVRNTDGDVLSGILVEAYVGSTLKGSKTTGSTGTYSIYVSISSTTTVTMKYYQYGDVVLTKSVTVNPGSYTTKDVTLPNPDMYNIVSRLYGGKTYSKFMAQPAYYGEFGITVNNLRLEYQFCPATGEINFASYSLTFSTSWDETYFYGKTLDVVVRSCPDSFVYLGKDRALGEYWDPGDQFTLSGNIPFTYNVWSDPYFTIKLGLGCPLLSETISMEMKFRIDEPGYNWFEYEDKCTRSYGAIVEEIFPSVLYDTWNNPTVITSL